jgi:predicted nucleic acid-binding Zn finger protein
MRRKGDKAKIIIERKAIRRHLFLPSNTEIWTVIGEEGDNLVNENPLFCTCKDFYFNLLKKKSRPCYHLRAFLRAKGNQAYSTLDFSDRELGLFMGLLLRDIK